MKLTQKSCKALLQFPRDAATQSLVDWHAEVERLARARGMGFLICPDPEAHRSGWARCLTPNEEIESQINDATR